MSLNDPRDTEIVDFFASLHKAVEFRDPEYDWITGTFDSSGNLLSDPQVGLAAGKIWIHRTDRRAAVPAVLGDRMYNFRRTAGKRCSVGYNAAGERVCIAPTNDEQSSGANEQAAAAQQLATPIPAINIAVGRVLPSANGGLEVFIDPIPQVGWVGGVVTVDPADLPASSGQFGWLVWYWPDGGTVPAYMVTVPVTTNRKENLLVSTARALALPVGSLRLYALTVYNGQTEFTYDNTRREDLRDWLNPTGAVFVDRTGGATGQVPTYDAPSDSFTLETPTGGSGTLPHRCTLAPNEFTVITGTSPVGGDNTRAGALYNWRWYQGTAAINNEFTTSFCLAAGTYTLYVWGTTLPNGGIVTWSIDGVNVGTMDWYSGGTVVNQVKTLSITIADGYHKLDGIMATKNASSSDYFWEWNTLWIKPASD